MQASHSFRLAGLSYALVALAYFPFVGTKGVTPIFTKALKAKLRGSDYLAQYVEYLSIHRKLHTHSWLSTFRRIETLCDQTRKSGHFDLEGKVAMYRIVFLLDRGDLGEARSYFDELMKRLSFFPEWLRDWIGILDLSIAVAEFKMSMVFFIKSEVVITDLLAGSHLFYATAYCYLEDLESASTHFELVLQYFHQMKIHHSGFTICITSLMELALVLDRNGMISRSCLKKVFKAARVHAKLVKRSAPIVKFYDHLRKRRELNLVWVEKLFKASDELGTRANSQLIRSHIKAKTPIDFNESLVSSGEPEIVPDIVGIEGIERRVNVFWSLIEPRASAIS